MTETQGCLTWQCGCKQAPTAPVDEYTFRCEQHAGHPTGQQCGNRTGEATLIDDPCPRCGNKTVLCILLVTEDGGHQHTWYRCVLWGRGRRSACDWSGWTVPGDD